MMIVILPLALPFDGEDTQASGNLLVSLPVLLLFLVPLSPTFVAADFLVPFLDQKPEETPPFGCK